MRFMEILALRGCIEIGYSNNKKIESIKLLKIKILKIKKTTST